MWIVQTGIAGALVLFVFLKCVIDRVILLSKTDYPFSFAVPVIVACSLIFGLFDHYLITLQQGQILAAFSLGLLFAKR